MYSIAWFITFVLLLLVELFTISLVSIWFVLGALAAFGVSYLTSNIWIQILVFLVVSFIAYLLTNLILASIRKEKSISSDSIVGKVGTITKKIKDDEYGVVEVAGKNWVCDSENEIPVGKKVRIVKATGNKLIVEQE